MGLPQIIWLAIIFCGIGIALAKDGTPKNDNYSFVVSLIAALIEIGLLYWGGFFG